MTDENTIITRIIDGEIDCFEVLVRRYQKPVICMINNLINDRHICEDIAQDVFFTAYKKLATFDHARSSFSTWLFTIARNKSINILRKKKIFPTNKLPEKPDLHNPADRMEHKEFYDKLEKTFQRLPAKQKTAFVLAELENLSYEEIAQIEGAKIGTIKSRINRAKKKLRYILKNQANRL
jgi:RNA polymerase sigma-70 factor, ECF subfamily